MAGRILGIVAGLAFLALAIVLSCSTLIGHGVVISLGAFEAARLPLAGVTMVLGLAVAIATQLKPKPPAPPDLGPLWEDEYSVAQGFEGAAEVSAFPKAPEPIRLRAPQVFAPILAPSYAGRPIDVLMDAAEAARTKDRPEDAMGHYAAAERLARAAQAETPSEIEPAQDLAAALLHTGELLERQGQAERALDRFAETLSLRLTLAARTPSDRDAQMKLAQALQRLGGVRETLGEPGRALDLYRQSLPILAWLAAENPDDPALSGALSDTRRTVTRLEGAATLIEA